MRYVDNTFTTNFFNTIGVDFKMKSIYLKNKAVRLQIWDTAGQERFRTITCNYYHGAHGIIVVYDITDRDSFNSVKMWMGEIKKYAQSNVRKLLVGNKKDLEDQREISFEEGKELADFYNVEFLETSAKDTIKIEESFSKLAEIVIDEMAKKIDDDDDLENGIALKGPRRKKIKKNCC